MIIITGASATGKSETAKVLRTLYGINKVVTHTTRKMRQGETNDIDYHFVTKEEFERLLKEDFFVEHAEYNGNYYGTSRPEIADNKVLIVETSGAKTFLALNDPHIVVFRLLASKDMRYSRMLERGDDLASINKRLENDVTWFADNQFEDPRIITINTEYLTLAQVAEEMYKLYNTIINKQA